MSEILKPTPGTFCWVELASSDSAAGAQFYQKLLGWGTASMEMGSGMTYIMANAGEGRFVAGMMDLPASAKAMGAPPHWMSFVAVDDVPAAVAKARGLGATVVRDPMPMGPGTLAILQDPSGGVFSIWKDPEPKNLFVYGEPKAMCWNELISTNVDIAGSFYAAMFDWKLEVTQMPDFSYTIFKNGDVQVGGMMAQPKEMAGAPTMWNVYFAVTDCDATVAATTALGGRLVAPAMEIPNVGRFAVLADPQGAVFSVLQPAVG